MSKTRHINPLILLLSAFLLSVFTSCGSDNKPNGNNDIGQESYIPETDWQFFMTASRINKPKLQETDNGCVFFHNGFIYKYEQGGMIMPLCSKINCLHDKETDPERRNECNAFLNDCPTNEDRAKPTLMRYRDDVFVCYEREIKNINDETACIVKISLDGKSKDSVFMTSSMDYPLIHRGYLYYYAFDYHVTVGEGALTRASLHRVNIEKKSYRDEVLFEPDDAHGFTAIQAYGSHVYFNMIGLSGYNSYVYDLTTGKINEIDMGMSSYKGFKGKLYKIPYDIDQESTYKSEVLQYTESGLKEKAVISGIAQSSEIQTDTRYFYLNDSFNQSDDQDDQTEGVHYQVYDSIFRLIDEFICPRTNSYRYDPPVGGTDYQYLRFEDQETGEWGLCIWDKSSIGSLNGKEYQQKRVTYNAEPGEDSENDEKSSTQEEGKNERQVSEVTDEYVAELKDWTDREADKAFSEEKTEEATSKVVFSDSKAEASAEFNITTPVCSSDERIIGVNTSIITTLSGYYIKDDRVYVRKQTVTCYSEIEEGVLENSVEIDIPEGAERFIGARADTTIFNQIEHNSQKAIEEGKKPLSESFKTILNCRMGRVR